MLREHIEWKKVPRNPGVYFFIGARREILYIGKATSLQNRIKSYFSTDVREKRSLLIEKMVHEAKKVEWKSTDSVLEAMLLETNLIRTHKPRFNTIAKDDKSYNHLVITDEEFPRVLVMRGKDVTEYEHTVPLRKVYGPFPNGTHFREALRIVRKLFQFYDGSTPKMGIQSKMQKGKIDFNRQIGLYPQECTRAEYARTIRHICLFFEGNKQRILVDLEKQMHAHAHREEFEEAQIIKRRVCALKHIQDVALIKDESRVYSDDRTMRIEAYDIAHMGGDAMVGALTVVAGGVARPSEYRKFTIRSCSDANDPKALREIVERRLNHPEWALPALIVADGSTAQVRAIESVLHAHNLVIPVVGVVKDKHHKPLRVIGSRKLILEHHAEILLANAEAHRFAISFHRKMRRRIHAQ